MVKHVVLFKFRDDVAVGERDAAYKDFRCGILSLAEKFPAVKKIEVGRNINPAESWDICLVGEFASMDALAAYSSHPEHLRVAGELKQKLAGRSCVDYEMPEN